MFCPLFVFSQAVEIEGQLKVADMDTTNAENHLVVKRADGTLATRMVASLPNTADTSRTLQSDLLLTSALCNCPSLPPAMIQSLLDNGYSIQDLVAFNISIQDLLDAGQTPLALNNAGVELDSLYGKTYLGGLIFYLDIITGNGLVSAPVDQSSGAVWGCSGFFIGGTMTAIGTGQANTDIIISCGPPTIASRLCNDLVVGIYDDWFLPSNDELNEMYFKIGPGAASPNTNIGGFGGSSFYWSSSEFNSNSAMGFFFGGGSQSATVKTGSNSVRAIRAF